MLRKVRNYIDQHRLLQPDGRYLVAVSGGADSVALLLLLQMMKYHVEAVHCNFQLRGEESLRDEDFVKNLCKRLDILLHLIHFDTRTYAQLHRVSIEMAARELRYRYFEQLRQDTGAADVCVAHHQDDSVETILINLLRGTGVHGLTGIRPRQGHIVRPLLCVSRKDILAWLETQHQPFVTDSTNLVADVWRNKVRLNVIPQLLDITPAAVSNILNTAQLLSETAQVADESIRKVLEKHVKSNKIEISSLQQFPSPSSVLFAWLEPYGFSSASIMQIANRLATAETGRIWQSATHEVCADRGFLLLQQREQPRPTLRIPEPGVYLYEEEVRIRVDMMEETTISRAPDVATLDAERLTFPLTLRPTETGDRFVPLGLKKGSQLVSDYLTDRKFPVFEKRRQLVLTAADGTIVWLVGQRPDERFRITEATKYCLRIQFPY